MERQTNQQQNEKTDPTIIPKSPTTVEEKQDAACESERVDDEETAMDVKQHCKTDMDPNDMEHDQVNEPISKQDLDRDLEKIGRKRDKSNPAENDK